MLILYHNCRAIIKLIVFVVIITKTINTLPKTSICKLIGNRGQFIKRIRAILKLCSYFIQISRNLHDQIIK